MECRHSYDRHCAVCVTREQTDRLVTEQQNIAAENRFHSERQTTQITGGFNRSLDEQVRRHMRLTNPQAYAALLEEERVAEEARLAAVRAIKAKARRRRVLLTYIGVALALFYTLDISLVVVLLSTAATFIGLRTRKQRLRRRWTGSGFEPPRWIPLTLIAIAVVNIVLKEQGVVPHLLAALAFPPATLFTVWRPRRGPSTDLVRQTN